MYVSFFIKNLCILARIALLMTHFIPKST